MKASILNKLLAIGLLILLGMNASAQKLPVGVSFKRLFLDYQTLQGGSFGAFKDYTDGWEFGFHAPLSEQFILNIPVKIGMGNVTADVPNMQIAGLDAQMHFYPLAHKNLFSPYLLAGLGGVRQGRDSFNMQVPVGIGLDIRIAKYAYFNIQSEFRYSSAENNNNFNYGIGIKYFFGRKQMDTVQIIPMLEKPKVDTDMDGIIDEYDDCPLEAGLQVFQGCPDTDSDGVPDNRDDCPVIAGLVEFSGCPDSDGDGVKDGADECPTIAGPKEFNGCPDTDGDGIEDRKDLCPSIAGIAAFGGCPDTDKDGIEDSKDKCPNTYGPISNGGCPIIEAADREVLTFAMKAVQFQLGKATLVTESYGILNQIVGIMNKYPDYKLSIDGHTDNTGSAEVNRKLSESRAKACYDYLVSKGIPASRMSYQGFGPTRPIADNSTYSGRTLNRRVEFNLTPGL